MLRKLLKPPNLNPKKVEQLKYLLIFYYILTLCYEWSWTWYAIGEYSKDIQRYEEDEIWKREFFKSTRNFFVFCQILTSLVLSLGLLATYRNLKVLLCVSIAMLIIEWGFEFIGIYTSMDFNVFVYKVIGMVMRPGLFILASLHAWVMKSDAQTNIV
ncbi:uncharacterized protein LOC141852572 [Brevipalpus obovatus]|uniref:uncharacterized protein LOC141852572 n=1 Tax=Brevipalpus obovatus TaxID=246614 RepID=UPI003D9EF1BC